MRILFILLGCWAGSATAQQHYLLVDAPQSVSFTIRHFGVSVDGLLSGISGRIDFDVHHPEHSHFDVAVQAASVQTGIDLRDRHLRKEEFFDSGKHPLIQFVSREVVRGGSFNQWIAIGKLAVKGTVREVSIPF